MANILKNADIYTASDNFKADILIEGEKISKIAENIVPAASDKVFDLSGLELYPGCIDAHTHFDLRFTNGVATADDFESGTTAAACGGTTTVIDFANPYRGQSVLDSIGIWQKKAEGRSAVDYAFHLVLVEMNETVKKEAVKAIGEGITSFKCFFAYRDLKIDDACFIDVLSLARETGALVSVHAENGDILNYASGRLLCEKKTAAKYHQCAHPVIAESEATGRAAAIAKFMDVPLYIVHLSCAEALLHVKLAREASQCVLAETCPQYLLLSDELYDKNGFEAAKWVMSPPLREKSNNEKLWQAIRDGLIQVISTDHCSFKYRGQKDIGGENDFTKIPNGAPGAGDRVNLIYTYGVSENRISKNKFAAVMSTNPAKIFGLYPRKGSIAIGSDADFTVIDPNKKSVVSIKDSRYKTDYNAYEGMALKGMVVKTFLRGELIYDDKNFLGSIGGGRFIKRSVFNPLVSYQ